MTAPHVLVHCRRHCLLGMTEDLDLGPIAGAVHQTPDLMRWLIFTQMEAARDFAAHHGLGQDGCLAWIDDKYHALAAEMGQVAQLQPPAAHAGMIGRAHEMTVHDLVEVARPLSHDDRARFLPLLAEYGVVYAALCAQAAQMEKAKQGADPEFLAALGDFSQREETLAAPILKDTALSNPRRTLMDLKSLASAAELPARAEILGVTAKAGRLPLAVEFGYVVSQGRTALARARGQAFLARRPDIAAAIAPLLALYAEQAKFWRARIDQSMYHGARAGKLEQMSWQNRMAAINADALLPAEKRLPWPRQPPVKGLKP